MILVTRVILVTRLVRLVRVVRVFPAVCYIAGSRHVGDIMTASMPPRPDASVSQLLDAATGLFRATLLKCLPFAMIGVLCLEVPNFYWVASGHTLVYGCLLYTSRCV